MSRYYDGDGDENFNNEGEFWQANYDRAMKGKRGRKALADLREALLALPEKKLIDRALCTVGRSEDEQSHLAVEGIDLGGVCAVGAYVWHQKVKAGMDPTEAFESLPTLDDSDHGIWETEEVGQSVGLTRYVAFEFAYKNDETFGQLSPEGRYQKFMTWLDTELAATS